MPYPVLTLSVPGTHRVGVRSHCEHITYMNQFQFPEDIMRWFLAFQVIRMLFCLTLNHALNDFWFRQVAFLAFHFHMEEAVWEQHSHLYNRAEGGDLECKSLPDRPVRPERWQRVVVSSEAEEPGSSQAFFVAVDAPEVLGISCCSIIFPDAPPLCPHRPYAAISSVPKENFDEPQELE